MHPRNPSYVCMRMWWKGKRCHRVNMINLDQKRMKTQAFTRGLPLCCPRKGFSGKAVCDLFVARNVISPSPLSKNSKRLSKSWYSNSSVGAGSKRISDKSKRKLEPEGRQGWAAHVLNGQLGHVQTVYKVSFPPAQQLPTRKNRKRKSTQARECNKVNHHTSWELGMHLILKMPFTWSEIRNISRVLWLQARCQLGHPKLQFRRLHQFGKLLEVDGAIARIVYCLEQPLHFPGIPRLRDSTNLSLTSLTIKPQANTKHPSSEFHVMPNKLPAMNTKSN